MLKVDVMTGSCKASQSVLSLSAKTSVSRTACHESTSESIDTFKVFEKRPSCVMTLFQIILVFYLAQLSSANPSPPPPATNSYQFKVTQTQVPPDHLPTIIRAFLFEVPSDDNSASVLVAAQQFQTTNPFECEILIYTTTFNDNAGVKGSLIIFGPDKAFCDANYVNTVVYQKLQKKIVFLTTSATYGNGVSVTSVETATGNIATPVNTKNVNLVATIS